MARTGLKQTAERQHDELCPAAERVSWASIVCGATVGLVVLVALTTLGIAKGLPGSARSAEFTVIAGAAQSMPRGPTAPPEVASELSMRIGAALTRDCRALIHRIVIDADEKYALEEQLAPEIAALADALIANDFEEARKRLIDSLHESTVLDRPSLTAEVDRWIHAALATIGPFQVREHRAVGRRARGPQVTPTTRSLAGWSFVVLFLGALASTLGGWLGSRSNQTSMTH